MSSRMSPDLIPASSPKFLVLRVLALSTFAASIACYHSEHMPATTRVSLKSFVSGGVFRTSSSLLFKLENPVLEDWSRSSIRFLPDPHYTWSASTEDNHRADTAELCGKFQHIRARLDYNYHAKYSCARQELQDSIIQALLRSKIQDKVIERCRGPPEPWVVFTAGVMGAGKSYMVQHLHSRGLFPLESFVVVDPDEIRKQLPEFNVYLETCAEEAGALTGKEAGMMAEILAEAALERGWNVLKDGSLRDAKWYEDYFVELRLTFPGIQLGIIHVTAPLDVISRRVDLRAEETGRIVPRDVLAKAVEQVPKSVEILKDRVDFFVEIDNSGKNDDDADQIIAMGVPAEEVKENFLTKCSRRRGVWTYAP